MSKGDPVPALPADAPKVGEVWRHYKSPEGYKVVGLAIDTATDDWVVVYEPLYNNPTAKLFTRPLQQWREVVEWEGKQVARFVKV